MMYGTRKEVTRLIKRAFGGEEKLALLVWSEQDVMAQAEDMTVQESWLLTSCRLTAWRCVTACPDKNVGVSVSRDADEPERTGHGPGGPDNAGADAPAFLLRVKRYPCVISG